jgi:hypothetical protein
MALVQGGPPEWVWERPADMLRWTVTPSPARNGDHTVFELRLDCGMQVLRVHFFNEEEMRQLIDAVSAAVDLGKVRPS